jgi:hypothetical protein
MAAKPRANPGLELRRNKAGRLWVQVELFALHDLPREWLDKSTKCLDLDGDLL